VSTINGLPIHVLVVHAVVVLVPLAALLAVLAAVWPAARRRIGVALPGLTFASLVLVPVATSAGEWLEEHVDANSYVERHAELGDGLLVWVLLLFVSTLVFWLLDHVAARSPQLGAVAAHPLVRPVVSVLMVLGAVVAVIQVVRIGDSGAQAAWHNNFRK
jgi:hypothetical protein